MGLALNLWNTFELKVGGTDWVADIQGEGESKLPRDATNLVFTTFCDEVRHLAQTPPLGARLINSNQVPFMSGLGSSSTATLAGILFAHSYVAGLKGGDPRQFDQAKVLERAIAVEGHGDNVAPALLGGFVVVMASREGTLTHRVPHLPLTAVVCVPEFEFPTSQSRAVLPGSYAKEDAIFNVGRALLVAEALRTGDDEILRRAMDDRIHEPYRYPLIPGAAQAKQGALGSGAVCVCLSGAGPGVIAFTRKNEDLIGQEMKQAFLDKGLESRYWVLEVSASGTEVQRMPI
jgi:homoserine kinase